MHLLYLDESGNHDAKYFVLAGLSVFETDTYWIAQEFETLQKKYLPSVAEPVHFHAADIRACAKEPWRSLGAKPCREILDAISKIIATSRCVLFGVAIERSWLHDGKDEYESAFESVVASFDKFLQRIWRTQSVPARGLVVVAASEYQKRIEQLAHKMRQQGTQWGQIRNLSELPLFTDARNSRLLQASDFVANTVFGRYEGGHTRHFDEFASKFDMGDGVYWGLCHLSVKHDSCMCPGCLSRRIAKQPE